MRKQHATSLTFNEQEYERIEAIKKEMPLLQWKEIFMMGVQAYETKIREDAKLFHDEKNKENN